MRKILYLVCSMLVMMACSKENKDLKVVVCVPVYGQSLALGEEAVLLTDIWCLYDDSKGRILCFFIFVYLSFHIIWVCTLTRNGVHQEWGGSSPLGSSLG